MESSLQPNIMTFIFLPEDIKYLASLEADYISIDFKIQPSRTDGTPIATVDATAIKGDTPSGTSPGCPTPCRPLTEACFEQAKQLIDSFR